MQESSHAGDLKTGSLIIAPLISGAVVFIADRATKIWLFPIKDLPQTPLPNLITLVHHQNYGVIANIPVPQMIIVIATLIVIGFVLCAMIKAIQQRRLSTAIALGILLGGALGNLYDRVINGFVFDWLLLFGRSAVNFADAGIVVGAFLYFSSLQKEKPRS